MRVSPCLRENDQGAGRSDAPTVREKKKPEKRVDRSIRCAHCGHQITSKQNRIEVDGSHQHALFNPAGIVYEISCFSKAPGCLASGPPSDEFAWFKGFTWRFAICSGCFSHLGWIFQSTGSSFFGLINKKLVG